jgi:hypothetical protein
VSVDLERATTRQLLDGLRSYLTTFDAQQDGVRRTEVSAITDSREQHVQMVHFSDALPSLQHYSFVTLLTLIVEARLTVFCKTLQEEHSFSPGIDGLRGHVLGRAHSFLTEHLQLTPPADLWRWLSDLTHVRDCIVYCAGNVKMLDIRDRRELSAVVKRRPGLSITPDHLLFNRAPYPTLHPEEVLRVGAPFCLEAVTAAQGLFGYLYQHRDPEVL